MYPLSQRWRKVTESFNIVKGFKVARLYHELKLVDAIKKKIKQVSCFN